MAKQKMVVKLSLDDAKKRTKALKTAVTMDGILSVAIDGDKLVAIGEGTDVITLTTLLRRKLGYADLISVTSENKGEEKKEQKIGEIKNMHPVNYPYQYSYPYQFPYVYHDNSYGQKFYSTV
ncbi:hypothetical protein LUZ60_008684 [Juncus effusus]|nr:hypothetical protein LUZ60_008684 [Juncus effusus]